jgi:hypothetical protein
MSITIEELVKRAYQNAKNKGFHDVDNEASTNHMLMVTELAEATEEVRKGRPPLYALTGNDLLTADLGVIKERGLKPEGEAIELADVVIRIADYFGHKGWDLEEMLKLKLQYNTTREPMHGKKY